MNAKEASAALEWVLRRKVIAIVRGQEPEHMVKLACALYEGGVDLIEVTFNQARPETWKVRPPPSKRFAESWRTRCFGARVR